MMHRTANIMEAVASFSKYPHRTGDMDSPRTIIFCAPRYTPLCSFGVIFIITLYLIFDYPYKYYTFKLFEV